MKLIRIAWNDAVADSCWTCAEDAINHTAPCCTTVGYLLKETDNEYIITSTITDSHDIMGFVNIPKNMVTNIYELSDKPSTEITLECE